MRRVSLLRLVSTGLVASLGLMVAASGCADNNSTLFIRGVMSQSSGGDCVFEPDGESPLLGSGVLDVAIRSTYVMPLLVGNQLIARGDADKLRTETARVVIRGAVVEVASADGTRTYPGFSTNAGGFIDPASGDNPGYGIAFVNAISSQIATELRGRLANPGDSEELNVSVYVYGDTLGNDEVESSTLTYPLFVCNGCLVDCSTGSLLSGCDSYPEEGLEVGCFPGQDTLTPCQLVLSDPDTYCSVN